MATGAGSNIQEGWAQRFGAMVERQHALYGALDALSQRQTVLVEQGDADGVLAVLRQRQAIVDEIVDIAEQARPFRDLLARPGQGLSADERERLLGRVGSMERLAAAINERDERDKERLTERREQLAAELAGVGNARRAVSAYGAGETFREGARFQDRKG